MSPLYAFCSLNLDKQTVKGSTALHYCCLTDNSECLKLLLRGKASIEIGKETHRQQTRWLWCIHCPPFSFSFNLSFAIKVYPLVIKNEKDLI